jgi:hypothetical protein
LFVSVRASGLHSAMAMVFGSESLAEMFAIIQEKCLSTIVGFGYMILQNRYCWRKSHAPMMTLRDFPIRVSPGVPMSQPVCASWSWVCGCFPSTGCILPIRCLSMLGWLAFTDLEDFSPTSFVACKKLDPG